MRFYTRQRRYYCGIDLHARQMYVCIISADGEVVFHKNMPAAPQPFLKAIAPFREDLVVGVECTFTWYWLADVCVAEGIEFVLGHALYMRAIHGAKVKNDRVDSRKIAALLRGGMFPMAYVYPRAMRATRDLLRRRTFLVRRRAELLTHIQNTRTQYNLPEFDGPLSRKGNRQGIAESFPDPEVQRSVQVDTELIDHLDVVIEGLNAHIARAARRHDPQALMLLKTIHGVGRILALVILYEIHTIERFTSVGEFCSYARLVRSQHESAGKKSGKGHSKIGNQHLKWAFSEAAALFLHANPEGMKYKKRLEKKHGKAKALSILAHRLGRAVYFMLKRGRAFDMKTFLAT
jgi:transposase